MRYKNLFIICLIPLILNAQDTSVSVFRNIKEENPQNLPVQLSKIPTKDEIAHLLFLTTSSPLNNNSIKYISNHGESSVPPLIQLLFAPNIMVEKYPGADTRTIDIFSPRKKNIIKTLEEIGTPSAIFELVLVAHTHPDSIIRGLALNALVKKYHQRIVKGKQIPMKDAVGEFINHLDDHTYIPELHMIMSQIAKEGIITWMGIDFGEPQFKGSRLMAGGSNGDLSAEAYGRLWWDENNQNLVWNGDTGHFELLK